MHDHRQPGDLVSLSGTFNLLYLAVSGHATCLTPFLRWNFGSEALGFNGIAALVVLVLYFCAYPSQGMSSFFQTWLALLLVQRLRTFWLRSLGRIIHSRYDGYPLLAILLPGMSEQTARWIEPGLCFLAGVFETSRDASLGRFLLLGAVSLAIKQLIDRQIDRKRVERIQDAEIEQRNLVQRLGRRRS